MAGPGHTAALAAKGLMTLGTMLLALRLAGAAVPFGGLLLATAVLVSIGYPLADLYLLQNTGTAVATLVDAALAAATLWAVGAASPGSLPPPALLVGTGALTLAELFFHRWLVRRVGIDARPGDVEPHEREE